MVPVMINLDYFLLARGGEQRRRLPELSSWFVAEHEILEVGPATADLTFELARDGFRVFACEPDDAARAVAVARLAAEPDVRERVSLLPLPFQAAPLPEVLGGALLSHVLFYLDAPTRALLWRELAARLVPGAHALVSRAWPTTSGPVARRLLGEPLTLGRFTYRRWFASEDVPGAEVPSRRYVNTFEVRDGEDVVCIDESSEVRPVLSEATAIAEINQACEITMVDENWLAATAPGRSVG